MDLIRNEGKVIGRRIRGIPLNDMAPPVDYKEPTPNHTISHQTSIAEIPNTAHGHADVNNTAYRCDVKPTQVLQESVYIVNSAIHNVGSGESDCNRIVLEYIMRHGLKSDYGVDVHDMIAHIQCQLPGKLTVTQIWTSVELLSCAGYIYSTINETMYKYAVEDWD